MSIIPLANQGGPVAEALRQKLSTAKWVKPNLQTKISSSKNKSTPPPKANGTLIAFGGMFFPILLKISRPRTFTILF